MTDYAPRDFTALKCACKPCRFVVLDEIRFLAKWRSGEVAQLLGNNLGGETSKNNFQLPSKPSSKTTHSALLSTAHYCITGVVYRNAAASLIRVPITQKGLSRSVNHYEAIVHAWLKGCTRYPRYLSCFAQLLLVFLFPLLVVVFV